MNERKKERKKERKRKKENIKRMKQRRKIDERNKNANFFLQIYKKRQEDRINKTTNRNKQEDNLIEKRNHLPRKQTCAPFF